MYTLRTIRKGIQAMTAVTVEIKRSFNVTEGRLHEILKRRWHFHSIKDNGSLFKTKKWKKRKAHAEKVMQHAHYLIGLMDHDFKTWQIFRRGSTAWSDVYSGTDQWYEIVDITEKS